MKSPVLVVILLIFSAFSCAYAQTILYAGSFDPYHLSHHQELLDGIQISNAKQAVILPIDQAYYHSVNSLYKAYPKVFPYEYRLHFISQAVGNHPKIFVSEQLKVIHQDVFGAILNEAVRFDKPILLIGTDILETWSLLPSFEMLLSHVSLLVSKDPLNQSRNEKMVARFGMHPKIQFIKSKSDGIRSKDLISSWLKNGRPPKMMLPEMPAQFDWLQANMHLENYRKTVAQFLRDDFNTQLLPVFSKVLPESLFQLIVNDEEIKEWLVFQDMQDRSRWGQLALKIQASNQFGSLPLFVQDYLSTHLYSAFSHPAIAERYRRNQHLLYLSSLASKQALPEPSKLKRVTAKVLNQINGQIFRFYKRHLVTHFKKLVLTGDISKDFGIGPQMAPLSSAKVLGSKTVTLYRGIPYSSRLENYLKSWKENGMLSKTALTKFIESGDLEAAIYKSQSELDSVGQRAAVLHHIFGDWRTSTPLISTSIDPNIARDFAGPNGLVITLEVPIEAGYFLNDLKYWKGTPWENSGNPASRQLEFAIPNQISPEWIKSVDTLGSVATQTTMGMSLGWRVRATYKMFLFKQQLKEQRNQNICVMFYSSRTY